MTELTAPHHRTVRRKVRTVRGDALVVALDWEGITIRVARRRQKFLLPYGSALIHAVELHVAALKRRKALERKARKAQRNT